MAFSGTFGTMRLYHSLGLSEEVTQTVDDGTDMT